MEVSNSLSDGAIVFGNCYYRSVIFIIYTFLTFNYASKLCFDHITIKKYICQGEMGKPAVSGNRREIEKPVN